jgi:hypothetical protein
MSKFYQDEFEQFLQDEVKQHRMYPSDQIWKHIRTELHGYKAWPALTFISLFVITALTVSTLLSNHPAKLVTPQFPVATEKNNAATTTAVTAEKYFHDIAPEQITQATFAGMESQDLLADRSTHRQLLLNQAQIKTRLLLSRSQKQLRLYQLNLLQQTMRLQKK